MFRQDPKHFFLQTHRILLGTAQTRLPEKSENVKLSEYQLFAVLISLRTYTSPFELK